VSGMNISHAYRLEREGVDNVENLAASEPIEIALRTGFPYPQVKTWVGEARPAHPPRPAFRSFCRAHRNPHL